MEILDLTKILKDVPKGTRLYSPIIGDVYFENIKSIKCSYAITCSNKSIGFLHFTKDGKYYNLSNGECLLFPSKYQRDWSKFKLPCQFKLGDVLIRNNGDCIAIFNKEDCLPTGGNSDVLYYNCFYNLKNNELLIKTSYGIGRTNDYRYANEKEKNILFDKLQEKGYFWNDITNSLEKYKFNIGDKIQDKETKEIYTIYDIEHAKYKVNVNEDIQGYVFAAFQNQFELYKEKFDITTLKPYDKVLIRRTDNGPWEPQLFSYLNNDKSFYLHRTVIVGSSSVKQCIPYEGNEHLVGTTDECDEYYKTW